MCTSIKIDDIDIKCDDHVKLLGVGTCIDYLLKFDVHIPNLCKKTAKQINVLLRLKQYLTTVLFILNRDSPWTRDHSQVCQSPNQYGPPVLRKSQIGDAESGADI